MEYDELEEDEEPHHSWLGGSTAAKFLLAGGAAGAGKYLTFTGDDVLTALQFHERVQHRSIG